MAQSKEYYRAQMMAANSSFKIGGVHMSGFLVKIAGTITVTDDDGTVLVSAQPVDPTIEAWIRIPLMFNTQTGGTVQLGGGAAGTLFL
jgi:hypothetical protein